MTNMHLDCAVVDGILAARSIEQAWEPLRSYLRRMGIDSVFYGANRLRGGNCGFGKPSDTMLLTDLPDEILSGLWNSGLYRALPGLARASQSEDWVDLSRDLVAARRGQLDAEGMKAIGLLNRTGLTAGWVIGLEPADAPCMGMLGVTFFGRDPKAARMLWQRQRHNIRAAARMLHIRAKSLPLSLDSKRLTKRQREVLRWVGAGKTTAEAATILGLSPATVEKHLRQVRDTLGVSTTTQAAVHAELTSCLFSVPG